MLTVIIIVVVVLVLALAVGGAVHNARRRAATAAQFEVALAETNEQLARAHADDKGWKPDVLDAAARRAFASRHPDAQIEALTLTQVIDEPGVEQDKAVFSVRSAGQEHRLLLGRGTGDWTLESLD